MPDVSELEQGAATRSDSPHAPLAPHWLPRHRLVVPDSPAHYCDRPGLTSRCAPGDRLLTLLMAPGGFGKTTLLAEACRRTAARGVPVAWVTLAREDDAATLDACLAFAFQAAGLDPIGQLHAGAAGPNEPHPRTALVLRALAASGRTRVLALDEIENASSPAAVALLTHLIQSAPPCLHLAMACRELPPGLDASRAVRADRTEILTVDDLRFSQPDIARFFDLELSRRELAAVAAESGGWPIALRIRRNDAGRRGAAETRVASHVVGNWIAGRFWEGLADNDRERVLDIGLMDWVDADLAEDVLESPGVLARLIALPRLAGLLEPVGGTTAGVHRLHPLLRQHCVESRRNADPARYRHVHRRVARALARRGQTVEAMRHAALADDPALAHAVFVENGGLQLWLREGTDRFAAADRYLGDQVAAAPRLAMSRCVALSIRGRLREARRLFAVAASAQAGDLGFETDRLLASGAMDVSGCRPFDDAQLAAVAADVARVSALPATRDLVRGAMACGLSTWHAHRAMFDTSVALARRARRLTVGRSAYLTMAADTQLGEVAMARGRVREARAHYRAARHLATNRFLKDPRMGAYPDMLMLELALERNRVADGADPAHIAAEPYRGDVPRSHYAATLGIAADLAHEDGGPEAALSAIETLSERAHDAGLTALDGLFAALRVDALAEAGRIAAAERVWHAAELPSDNAACLQFRARGWREIEALACARVRLLAARGDFAAALRLERALAAGAAELGLRRTVMRALALRVRLCAAAGDRDAAHTAVADYLALYIRTDYARPIMRAGKAAWTALERALDTEPEGPTAAAAERLLAMGRDGVAAAPPLTAREKDVLALLDTNPDKRIAARLGLSVRGVRYRLERIFAKLGVQRRADAVRRARALGILITAD